MRPVGKFGSRPRRQLERAISRMNGVLCKTHDPGDRFVREPDAPAPPVVREVDPGEPPIREALEPPHRTPLDALLGVAEVGVGGVIDPLAAAAR